MTSKPAALLVPGSLCNLVDASMVLYEGLTVSQKHSTLGVIGILKRLKILEIGDTAR